MSANGKLTDAELAVIPDTGGQRIAPGLLASVEALRAAFEAEFDKPLEVVEAYRPYTTQVLLYDGWVKRLPGYNLASPPGSSPHGYGVAIDFGSGVNVYGSPEKEWMDANAPAYGWSPTGNTFKPREAWHFVGGGPITASLTAHRLDNTPKRKDAEMIIMSSPNLGQVAITAGDGAHALRGDVAGVLRESWPSHDYTEDYKLETEIREAWTRANVTADRLEDKVAETIARMREAQQPA